MKQIKKPKKVKKTEEVAEAEIGYNQQEYFKDKEKQIESYCTSHRISGIDKINLINSLQYMSPSDIDAILNNTDSKDNGIIVDMAMAISKEEKEMEKTLEENAKKIKVSKKIEETAKSDKPYYSEEDIEEKLEKQKEIQLKMKNNDVSVPQIKYARNRKSVDMANAILDMKLPKSCASIMDSIVGSSEGLNMGEAILVSQSYKAIKYGDTKAADFMWKASKRYPKEIETINEDNLDRVISFFDEMSKNNDDNT